MGLGKKITPGEHNKKVLESAAKVVLGGPIVAGIKAASAGVYDIMNRSDNQASSAMVEKATNDKGIKENYGLPRDQWEKPTEYDALKVEQKARDKGYVPPSERNKPKEATKQDVRPRGRVPETGKVTPAQEREMMFKALKESDGPKEDDPVKSRMDLKK